MDLEKANPKEGEKKGKLGEQSKKEEGVEQIELAYGEQKQEIDWVLLFENCDKQPKNSKEENQKNIIQISKKKVKNQEKSLFQKLKNQDIMDVEQSLYLKNKSKKLNQMEQGSSAVMHKKLEFIQKKQSMQNNKKNVNEKDGMMEQYQRIVMYNKPWLELIDSIENFNDGKIQLQMLKIIKAINLFYFDFSPNYFKEEVEKYVLSCIERIKKKQIRFRYQERETQEMIGRILSEGKIYIPRCSCRKKQICYGSLIQKIKECQYCKEKIVNWDEVVNAEYLLSCKIKKMQELLNFEVDVKAPTQVKLIAIRIAYIYKIFGTQEEQYIEQLFRVDQNDILKHGMQLQNGEVEFSVGFQGYKYKTNIPFEKINIYIQQFMKLRMQQQEEIKFFMENR